MSTLYADHGRIISGEGVTGGSTIGTPVEITTSDYTCPSDGYFLVAPEAAAGKYTDAYVNGIVLIHLAEPISGTLYGYPMTSLFVRKGSVIKIATNSSLSDRGKFYPLS